VTLLRSWRWNELWWWKFLLEACVAPGRLPVGWVCSVAARWLSRYSLLCKDNILCNNVYLINTSVFYIHILAVCMTTWSWAYIRCAPGFGLKTGCDKQVPPHVRYGTACLPIRYAIGCVSCSVEWGWLLSLWSNFVTFCVNCLNYKVPKGPLCVRNLSTTSRTSCRETVAKCDILL
jgi:hypothetical protein